MDENNGVKEEGEVNGSLDNVVLQWIDEYHGSVDNYTQISFTPKTINGMSNLLISTITPCFRMKPYLKRFLDELPNQLQQQS